MYVFLYMCGTRGSENVVVCVLSLAPLVSCLRVTPAVRPRTAAPPPVSSVPASPRGDALAAIAGVALLSIVEPASASDVSWIAPTKLVLGPMLSIGTIFFLIRVVLSWFPKYSLDELPWSVVAIPTEPLLKTTRKVVPPVAGVDISPIIWVSILSFISEILLGPQGLLTIMQKRG